MVAGSYLVRETKSQAPQAGSVDIRAGALLYVHVSEVGKVGRNLSQRCVTVSEGKKTAVKSQGLLLIPTRTRTVDNVNLGILNGSYRVF